MVKIGKVTGLSFFSVFYFITGIALLLTLMQSASPPLHVVFIGALSLIVSYGLSKTKRWTVFLTALTALPSLSFSFVTIYAIHKLSGSGLTEILLLLAMNLYVILLALSLLYVMQERNKFG